MARGVREDVRPVVLLLLVAPLLALPLAPALPTGALPLDPATYGRWSDPIALPVQGEYAVLLPTGEILLFEVGSDAKLFDPRTGDIIPVPLDAHINCVGIALMDDGRVLVNGGHTGDAWHGTPASFLFDPWTRGWTQVASMNVGRYYPGLIQLSDGRMLTVSGNGPDGGDASIPEVFDGATWTLLPQAEQEMEFYPRMHVIPGGDVVSAGQDATAYRLDAQTLTWSPLTTSEHGKRWGGTSTLLADMRSILVFGGGDLGVSSEGGLTGIFRDDTTRMTENVAHGRAPATTSAQILDTLDGSWRDVSSLSFARRDGQSVLLPSGDVLAVGGAYGVEPLPGWTEHALSPELYDGSADAWSVLAPANRQRGYHSSAILLPDGRVFVSGGDFETGAGSLTGVSSSGEFFAPPYLFGGPRPTIVAAPAQVQLGAAFSLQVAGDVDEVVLVRLGSMTHSLNTDQRIVTLPFVANGPGAIVARIPTDAGAAPPGWYMVFAMSQGIPSEAAMVRLVALAS